MDKEEKIKGLFLIGSVLLMLVVSISLIMHGLRYEGLQENTICEEYAAAENITMTYPDKIYHFNNISIPEKKLNEICIENLK